MGEMRQPHLKPLASPYHKLDVINIYFKSQEVFVQDCCFGSSYANFLEKRPFIILYFMKIFEDEELFVFFHFMHTFEEDGH